MKILPVNNYQFKGNQKKSQNFSGIAQLNEQISIVVPRDLRYIIRDTKDKQIKVFYNEALADVAGFKNPHQVYRIENAVQVERALAEAEVPGVVRDLSKFISKIVTPEINGAEFP